MCHRERGIWKGETGKGKKLERGNWKGGTCLNGENESIILIFCKLTFIILVLIIKVLALKSGWLSKPQKNQRRHC
jgi:hypothetical protein